MIHNTSPPTGVILAE